MRRRAALVGLLLLVTGCAPDPVRLDVSSSPAAVLSFVAAQQDGASRYRRPAAESAQALAGAVLALGRGDRTAAERMARVESYRVVDLGDDALALAPVDLPDERGWGLYVVRPDGTELAVEVPHPRADLDTERLGPEVAQAVRARYLLVAGAARDAADGAADVAREPGAVFSAVHAALAGMGVPALQVHGFAADSLPGVDLVVSPGATEVSPLVRRIADAGADAGLAVCRPWRERCGRLEGRANVQGQVSKTTGAPFVHLEVTRALRERTRRLALVEVLARAVSS